MVGSGCPSIPVRCHTLRLFEGLLLFAVDLLAPLVSALFVLRMTLFRSVRGSIYPARCPHNTIGHSGPTELRMKGGYADGSDAVLPSWLAVIARRVCQTRLANGVGVCRVVDPTPNQ